jgi:hypothetical protein
MSRSFSCPSIRRKGAGGAMQKTVNYMIKCYASAEYPSPTDASGFDTPPSSSAATSS